MLIHIGFAALHALGKYVEESGLDSIAVGIAVEKDIYSPTTLHQIFGGRLSSVAWSITR